MLAPINVHPLDRRYHGGEEEFREQMAVLYFTGTFTAPNKVTFVKLIRSFLTIGTPGMSGFDGDHPGMDTEDGWKILDELIENHQVRGIFHTHPEGMHDFSIKDQSAQIALAQANGIRPLWHGVQSESNKSAHFICLQMLEDGSVQCYDYRFVSSDLDDPVVLLPCFPKMDFVDGVHRLIVT